MCVCFHLPCLESRDSSSELLSSRCRCAPWSDAKDTSARLFITAVNEQSRQQNKSEHNNLSDRWRAYKTMIDKTRECVGNKPTEITETMTKYVSTKMQRHVMQTCVRCSQILSSIHQWFQCSMNKLNMSNMCSGKIRHTQYCASFEPSPFLYILLSMSQILFNHFFLLELWKLDIRKINELHRTLQSYIYCLSLRNRRKQMEGCQGRKEGNREEKLPNYTWTGPKKLQCKREFRLLWSIKVVIPHIDFPDHYKYTNFVPFILYFHACLQIFQ